MLVVDKPAPMACHPLRPGERRNHDERHLWPHFLRWPPSATIGVRAPGPSAEQRNSGALLVALEPQAFTALREAIRAGPDSPRLQALVAGNIKKRDHFILKKCSRTIRTTRDEC